MNNPPIPPDIARLPHRVMTLASGRQVLMYARPVPAPPSPNRKARRAKRKEPA